MRVSIAMSTYNGGKYVRAQLDSILSQTYPIHEIIVCDDQSFDGTQQILSEYSSKNLIRFFQNESRLGVINNFKKAILLCEGDYISLADQDDVWERNKIELSVEAMKKIELKNLPCLIFSDLQIMDEKLNRLEPSLWQNLKVYPKYETFGTVLYGNIITGCTVLINRDFLKYVKEMPSIITMHDSWFGLIAYGLGKVAIVYQATVKFRRHGSNVTNVQSLTEAEKILRFFKLMIQDLRQGHFLKDELKQAEIFYNLYKNDLSNKDRTHLDKFLALRSSNFFSRKIRTFFGKRLPFIFLKLGRKTSLKIKHLT